MYIQEKYGVFFNKDLGFTLTCHAAVGSGEATGFVLGFLFYFDF